MSSYTVYVVCARGQEDLGERIAQPLQEEGYDVEHGGTVLVGESFVGWAAAAISSGGPIVVCATALAAGSRWANKIVNAAHSDGIARVFVIQMEEDAYVEHLALRAKVARYYQDPRRGIRELLEALRKYYPLAKAVRDVAAVSS